MGKKGALIELRNVAKYYYMGDNIVKALNGINIDIEIIKERLAGRGR